MPIRTLESDASPQASDAGRFHVPSAPSGPARLLAELTPGQLVPSLADHRRRHPAPPVASRRPRHDLIDLVERAGLRGRGGAAFPAARKLRAVADAPGRRRRSGPAGRPVVVVNGAEGEPASAKDRLLLTRLPHLVIDGALLAAAAVGADQVLLCVDRTNGRSVESLRRALLERLPAARRTPVEIRIATPPPRYVAGEASALVHWLNDGPAKPMLVPPRLAERGVAGRPTLVQNAETLAHLAQICTYGADWFRGAGTRDEPGTTLVTVTDAASPGNPLVLEVGIGKPVGEMLTAAGLGARERVQAVLVGGYFGAWVATADVWSAPFSHSGLLAVGASPGAGILVALPAGACGLVETARVLEWFASESAGQCGPCLYGLADVARAAADLARGSSAPAGAAQLRRWADEIEGRGACHHPDGAVRLLRSALGVFADDVARHERGEPCRGAWTPPFLPVPVPPDTWR